MPATPHFPTAALTFLKALARHNDREWFRARKEVYERDVRGPMVAIVEQLDRDFRRFAPELVASPKTSIFRIYRDTRFSGDKSPLKTNIGALFPHRDLPRKGGAGLYVELSAKYLGLAGGLYHPSPEELRTVRQHVAANVSRLRSIVEATTFVRDTGGLQGDALERMPLGFPADHPGADYLRQKQFYVWRELPPKTALDPAFYPTLVSYFKTAMPLVRFLNEPLLTRAASGSRLAARG